MLHPHHTRDEHGQWEALALHSLMCLLRVHMQNCPCTSELGRDSSLLPFLPLGDSNYGQKRRNKAISFFYSPKAFLS